MGSSFEKYIGYNNTKASAIDSSVAMIKDNGYHITGQRRSLSDDSIRFIHIIGYGWYKYDIQKRYHCYTAYPVYFNDTDKNIIQYPPYYPAEI